MIDVSVSNAKTRVLLPDQLLVRVRVLDEEFELSEDRGHLVIRLVDPVAAVFLIEPIVANAIRLSSRRINS